MAANHIRHKLLSAYCGMCQQKWLRITFAAIFANILFMKDVLIAQLKGLLA